jgi:hypothetical protein
MKELEGLGAPHFVQFAHPLQFAMPMLVAENSDPSLSESWGLVPVKPSNTEQAAVVPVQFGEVPLEMDYRFPVYVRKLDPDWATLVVVHDTSLLEVTVPRDNIVQLTRVEKPPAPRSRIVGPEGR